MKDVYRFVRVTGRGERDAARNLEVTSWFLGIGSKEEMQEKDKDVKNCLFTCSQRLRRRQFRKSERKGIWRADLHRLSATCTNLR